MLRFSLLDNSYDTVASLLFRQGKIDDSTLPITVEATSTMFSVVSLFSFFIFALAASAFTDPGYNCHPGQECWPSYQEWQQFNQTVGGQLHQTIPMGAPCYSNSSYHDVAACDSVEGNYSDSISREAYYGQTYWLNWEACGTSGCSLYEPDPEETLYSSCSLGRLAPYYVVVRSAEHISAALQFAHVHNIRISIKNTGHDFFGRSAVPDSLAIWTHNLNSFDFYPNFTASSCPSANGQNVGEMGAGVVAGDAYRFYRGL